MFREEIDYFHAPQVSLKVLFAVWSEKVRQRRRSGSSLGHGPQKLRRWLRDAVITQQRFAQCRLFASWSLHWFIPDRTERVDHFINQLGIVGGVNRQRIAHFKGQTPSRQIELKMPRVLRRFQTAKTT